MTTNPLGMSDEEFLNQPLPETGEASGVTTTEPEATQEIPEDTSKTEIEPTTEKLDAAETVEGASGDDTVEAAPASDKVDEVKEPEPAAVEPEKKTGETAPASEDGKAPETKEPAPAADVTGSKEETPPNFEELYKGLMAPIKANGKTLEIKSPEELRQLVQMGANYTRKLQELAPARRIATMAQNNGITEEKLNFLIDLDKGNPEAIKKLIKDSGIDPLDIDLSVDSEYRVGSHQVNDAELNFRTHVEELASNPTGLETIKQIDTWDQDSKDFLWQHPEVMSAIHTQRENGIYTKITEEMNRRTTLGTLLPSTPFLKAYHEIGDQLAAAGVFKDIEGLAPEPEKKDPVPAQADPTPVVTRPAAPAPLLDSGDKADAAAPTRAAPGKAKETTNFLAMSDEDFLKAANLRV